VGLSFCLVCGVVEDALLFECARVILTGGIVGCSRKPSVSHTIDMI